MVTRKHNTLWTTAYRKATHTDRLLDQTSCDSTSHKVTTVRTLTRRAQIVCNLHDIWPTKSSTWTLFLLRTTTNNTDFIERNTYIRPNDSSNNSYSTTAIIPYIRGTDETIARILRPYNIPVAHKSMFTLRRLNTNVEDKHESEDRPGGGYKIKCSKCPGSFIGKTTETQPHNKTNKHELLKRVTSTTTSPNST